MVMNRTNIPKYPAALALLALLAHLFRNVRPSQKCLRFRVPLPGGGGQTFQSRPHADQVGRVCLSQWFESAQEEMECKSCLLRVLNGSSIGLLVLTALNYLPGFNVALGCLRLCPERRPTDDPTPSSRPSDLILSLGN